MRYMNERAKARITLLLCFALAVVLVGGMGSALGCRRTPEPPSAPETPETPEPPPESELETATVRLYFVRGEKIGVAGREVTADTSPEAIAEAAVAALLEGPSATDREFGLSTAIPDGVRVNGVEFAGSTATLDLTGAFASGGGSLSMQLRAAQVVCTLTQFDGIDSVSFKIDGTPTDNLGGEGIKIGPTVGRQDFEDALPAILVEEPYPGQVVTSPVTASGSSNTFEATHQLEVVDPEGLIVTEQFVTATSGTGTRGTWTATVEFTNAHPGRLGALIFYESSAKDGSRINIVEVPVMMN